MDIPHPSPTDSHLSVYPNPVSDILYLKGLPYGSVDYAIFNIFGQKAAAGTSHGSIPVAGLSKGVYLLQLKGDSTHEMFKFVVK